jgi:hypothetical protein
MTDRPRDEDVASIAPDPVGIRDGVGFPEGKRQREGGQRPGDAGGFWSGGEGGGPAGREDGGPAGRQDEAIDWEDRQRPGMAGEG